MDFPVIDLTDEDARYAEPVRWFHPEGPSCARGNWADRMRGRADRNRDIMPPDDRVLEADETYKNAGKKARRIATRRIRRGAGPTCGPGTAPGRTTGRRPAGRPVGRAGGPG